MIPRFWYFFLTFALVLLLESTFRSMAAIPPDCILAFQPTAAENLVVDTANSPLPVRFETASLAMRGAVPIIGELDPDLPVRTKFSALLFDPAKTKGFLIMLHKSPDSKSYWPVGTTNTAYCLSLTVDLSTLLLADSKHQKTSEILGGVLLNEKKDDNDFFDHAFFVSAHGLADYYGDYVLKHQSEESDPARRLALSAIAFEGVGPKALPFFAKDIAQMSDFAAAYKGPLAGISIDGLVARNALQMKKLATADNFEMLWTLLAKQHGKFKAVFLRSLCNSSTSGKRLPSSLLAAHRGDLLDWARTEPDDVSFQAFRTLAILDHRGAMIPRTEKEFSEHKSDCLNLLK